MPTSTSADLASAGRESARGRIRRSAPAVVAVTAVLLAPLIAGATLAIVAAAESPLQSADQVAPLIGAVESAERTDDAQVSIAVEFSSTPVVTVSGSGVVTAVGFVAGDEVITGTRLVAVDDRDIIAYTAAAPLFRDIARGTTGRDVATAQGILGQLGFDPGVADGTVRKATERAILAFNKAHGYGSSNTVLSLASLSWVGVGPVTVATAKATLGSTVGPGAVLFEGVATATAVTVSETPGIAKDVPLHLVVGETATDYEPGSGRITDPVAVAEIAQLVGTATDRLATLRRAEPLRVGSVPAAAVVADRSGASCVFPDVDGDPIPVEPRGGSLGTVDLDESLIGRSVLLNPREVRTDLRCAVN